MTAADHLSPQFVGATAKKYFKSNRSYKIIDSHPDLAGSTWTSGGCRVAAEALHQTLPGSRIHGVYGQSSREAEHFVVEHQNHFLDADGASTARELTDRWKTQEGVKGAHLRRVSDDELYGSSAPNPVNTETGESASEQVAKHLQTAFNQRRRPK
jgi:hypothetical protein